MKTTLILAGIALALAGCNQSAAPPDSATADIATMEGGADGYTATTPAEAGPGYRLDAAIPKDQIATDLRLAEPPAYRPADDSLLLQVEVDNRGDVALVGQGEFPVQLGATLAGPDGVDKAPGRRDFVRVRLPLLQPGASTTVRVRVPAQEILGMALQVDLVQERAGWFGRNYGQAVLDVGRFQRCDGAVGTLCDAAGVPVRTTEGPTAAGAPRPGAAPEGAN